MLGACNGNVIGLHREAVGPLRLADLAIPVGTARPPTAAELQLILSLLSASCRVAKKRRVVDKEESGGGPRFSRCGDQHGESPLQTRKEANVTASLAAMAMAPCDVAPLPRTLTTPPAAIAPASAAAIAASLPDGRHRSVDYLLVGSSVLTNRHLQRFARAPYRDELIHSDGARDGLFNTNGSRLRKELTEAYSVVEALEATLGARGASWAGAHPLHPPAARTDLNQGASRETSATARDSGQALLPSPDPDADLGPNLPSPDPDADAGPNAVPRAVMPPSTSDAGEPREGMPPPTTYAGEPRLIIDLCCGKGLLSMILSYEWPCCHVVMIDNNPKMNMAHVDTRAQLTYHASDLHSDACAHMLSRTLAAAREADPRACCVAVGVHLCGHLSPRAIHLFGSNPTLDTLLLVPCCLHKRDDVFLKAEAKRLGQDPHELKTMQLCRQLETICGPAGGVSVVRDASMRTNKGHEASDERRRPVGKKGGNAFDDARNTLIIGHRGSGQGSFSLENG